MSELEEKLEAILSSPEEMEKLMGIARSLSGSLGGAQSGPAAPAAGTSDPGPDPKLMSMLSGFLSGTKPDEGKAALLRAMRPFLRPERQQALDEALRMAGLAKMAKLAMNASAGGDGVV